MTIETRLFDADGTDREVELELGLTERLGDRQLLWVDIDGADEPDLEAVGNILGFERQSLHNLLNPIGRPRLDVLGEYFEINVVAIDKEERPVELDLLAGRNWVATIHHDPIAFIGEFRERIGPDTGLGVLDASSFLAALLDWQIGTYFVSVDDLEHQVDRLDERALLDDDPDKVLRDLLELRRRVGSIRRTLTPHREVFAALARPDFTVIASSQSAAHFRAIADRLERAISAVENARELLIGSFEILMTRTGQRTNDVMRILTIISVILLPAVVLAGVMGMNFEVGFFEDPAMFWVVIGAMAAIAVLVLIVARRQRWI